MSENWKNKEKGNGAETNREREASVPEKHTCVRKMNGHADRFNLLKRWCGHEHSGITEDSIEVQEKALQTLAFITKVNPQNRTMVAQTDNVIPTLASLTNSSSPIIQTLSLLTLFNLSLNPDLKQSLADMETIYYLNSLIISTSCSLDSSKLASSLICSLAMHDKNKAKFGVAGTVQLLVKAIEGSHDADHLLSSLAELVHFHGNCTLAVRAGAVPVLLRVAQGTDNEDLAGTSLAVLSLLARFDEGLNGLKRTDEIVKAMLSIMKGRSLLSKEGAADILIRLFDDNEDCAMEALMMPEFSSVLADLCVRGSVRVRDKANLLMRKMAKLSLDSYGSFLPA